MRVPVHFVFCPLFCVARLSFPESKTCTNKFLWNIGATTVEFNKRGQNQEALLECCAVLPSVLLETSVKNLNVGWLKQKINRLQQNPDKVALCWNVDNVAVSASLKSASLQSTVCEHACACLCCAAEEEKLINCGCDLTWSLMLADLEKKTTV